MATSAREKLSLICGLGALAFCVACGSSSGNTPAGTGTGNFSKASLKGQYVYQISGIDFTTNNAPYREAGVFTADGNGNITNGTDDFTEVGMTLSTNSTNGVYAISNDGTGTLSLNFANGTLNFGITLVSSSKAYLIEADNFVNAGGVIELQNTSALSSTPSGRFVFRIHSNTSTSYLGSGSAVGVFAVRNGAISGFDDVNRGGVFDNNTALPLSVTGTLSAPASIGRGTGTITDSANVTLGFNYYIVDSGHIRFLLTSPSGAVGLGQAETQTGSAFSDSSLSGGYAFGSRADDSSFLNDINTVGNFAARGNGQITAGAYDSTQNGASSANVSLTGSYSVASNGRAAVTLNPSGTTVQQVFWMVSPARAYFLTNNSSKVEDGTLDQQQASSFTNGSLNGQYAFVMDGFDLNNSVFIDRVGWISWNGSGGLTWNELVNASGAVQNPGFLSGTYSVSSSGRVAAAVNNLSQNIVLYLVSGNSGYMLQNDGGVGIIGATAIQ